MADRASGRRASVGGRSTGAFVFALLGAAAGCGSILGFEESTALSLESEGGVVSAAEAGAVDGGTVGSPNGQVSPVVADAGPPAARFAPVSVDFGKVECAGDSPDPLALMISNVGGATLAWSTSLSDDDAGPFHIVGDTSGTVAANNEIAVAVSVDPLDDSEVSGQVDTATLFIRTNDPRGEDQEIQVQRTASGGQLVSNEKVLQFLDGAPDSGVQTQTFTLTNIGDRGVTMMGMLTADPSFDVTWPGGPGSVNFDNGDTLTFTVTYDPALTLGTPNAVTFDVDGPLCGDPPVVIVIPGNVTQ